MKSETKTQPQVYANDREARVAEALRDNLRRRKVQQQNRRMSERTED